MEYGGVCVETVEKEVFVVVYVTAVELPLGKLGGLGKLVYAELDVTVTFDGADEIGIEVVQRKEHFVVGKLYCVLDVVGVCIVEPF